MSAAAVLLLGGACAIAGLGALGAAGAVAAVAPAAAQQPIPAV